MPGTNVSFLHGHCVEHVGFLVSLSLSLSWRLVANWVEYEECRHLLQA